MVGSYSSMKWFWMSWIVKADLPTPPPPTMTSLYSVIEEELGECCRESEPFTLCNVFCNNSTSARNNRCPFGKTSVPDTRFTCEVPSKDTGWS